MISDDDMRVQLALIKLGVVAMDSELDTDMAKVLWLSKYIVWSRLNRADDKPVLTITDDGEAFLNK
jgi:hypothetical protein